MIKKYLTQIEKCVLENKLETVLFLGIFLVGFFVRVYRISDTLPFLGDEGRDALIVKRMIVDKDFTLIGPVTSVGNMYLGPFYYYMMLPAMVITDLDPVGPAYMVAVIGVITLIFVYMVGRSWFGIRAAVFGSLFFSLSAMVVKWTRTSWNPNPMPFFSLILIWAMYKYYEQRKAGYLLLAAVCLGIVLQLHYFGLVLAGVIGVIWFAGLIENRNDKKFVKKTFICSFIGLVAVLVLLSPLFVFDFRHEFLNYKAISLFFSERTPDFSLWQSLKNTEGRLHQLIGGLFTIGWMRNLSFIYLLSVLGGFVVGIKDKKTRRASIVVLVWFLVGILGLAVYSGDVYPHYMGYIFIPPFLSIGIFLSYLSRRKVGVVISSLLVGYFCYLNISNTPFLKPLGWDVRDVERLSEIIYEDVGQEDFNIVWISPVKDYRAMNYRFFLEKMGKRPLGVENYDGAEVLYVIVEGVNVDPVNYETWELSKFGKAKVVDVIRVERGPVVYKLRKAEGESE